MNTETAPSDTPLDGDVTRLFAVVVTSKEARSGAVDNPVVTPEGTKFIVTEDYQRWVEATSTKFKGKVPVDAKIFNTAEAAQEFAERWGGHPWYCEPSGDYEIIEVEPRYRKVLDGYDVVL